MVCGGGAGGRGNVNEKTRATVCLEGKPPETEGEGRQEKSSFLEA